MQKLRARVKLFVAVIATTLLTMYPYQAFAETLGDTTTTIQAEASPQPATTTSPQPETQTSEPEHTYTYDPATGHWNTEEWQYSQGGGAYQKTPAPVAPVSEPPAGTTPTQPTSPISNQTDISADTTTNLSNQITSTATSGDASVTHNTLGGSATSGDAHVDTTLLNMVNSTLGADSNQKVAQFTQDITGDVNGDIILNPLLLKAMLEAKASDNSQTTISANTNQSIANNIQLNATSGNATVSGNTQAGSATSGNATAVANVVNILNSMIAANQSFVGTINIYGNLNGDILIAPDFIPQMIANNGGSSAPATTQVSSKDSQSIVNTISAAANSGAASVLGNTSAGSATSGSANSNIVIFNLSGHEVVAQNSLLVFVNVLGKWVGVIVDAPQGATAAMIGNGVSSNTETPDLVVNADSKQGITNTITVDASSGNALVSRNTNAGNAISGNATALVNVANVTNNQLSLGGWFGVLFINVFNNWFGSFGIDTPYGNPIMTPVSQPIAGAAPAGSTPIGFRPNQAHANRPQLYTYLNTITKSSAAATPDSNVKVASAKTTGATNTNQPVLGTSTPATTTDPSLISQILTTAGVVVFISLVALGAKRFL